MVGGGSIQEVPPIAGGSVQPDVVEIPYPPVEDNVSLLRDWLVRQFKEDVFNENRIPFPSMRGRDQHIHLINEHVVPHAVHTPLSVPYHLEAAVKEILRKWVLQGIITPVNVGEEVNWCTRMVVVAKKDGTPRITVDFQELNKFIKRETHHTPRPFDAICRMCSKQFLMRRMDITKLS